MLAGAACAALMALPVPAGAATNPQLPGSAAFDPAASQAVASFYASRPGAPLWFASGGDSAAARTLLDVLQRAPLDGLSSGPAMAAEAQALIARAAGGDRQALESADHLLSAAWIEYVEALTAPPSGMIYADQWVV